MEEAVHIAGLIMFAANYSTGWLLHYGVIRMGRFQHRLLYASIVAMLIAYLPFVRNDVFALVLTLFSLLMMVILPFGRKGGAYHIAASTAGLAAYCITFFA